MFTQFKNLKSTTIVSKEKFISTGGQIEIKVFNNDINKAMRQMKRKLQQQGMFRELKKLRFHEKPSAKRKRKKEESIRRGRKRLRKLKRFA